jgi:ADP-ribosylglycohydrolase
MLVNVQSAILGSFVGDSFALGTHWVYDQNMIKEHYGVVSNLLKPELVEYHSKKGLGDFTHYGDQAYQLLVSVSNDYTFNLDDFSSRFRAMFKGEYNGYVDHATQQTLDLIGVCTNFKDCQSHSTDLGGASQIAPLLLSYSDDLDAMIKASDKFIAFTHNDIRIKQSGAFFAHVTSLVLHGSYSPLSAITFIVDKYASKYSAIIDMIKTGLNSVDKGSSSAIKELGMSCDVNGALASTVHVIVKYQNSFREAMINNVMAGGDSAARGMLIGMVLGAYLGVDGVPNEWMKGMNQYTDIIQLIDHTKHVHYYDVA